VKRRVALALYCFLMFPNDYRRSVILAANNNGDSDWIACIAGSLAGPIWVLTLFLLAKKKVFYYEIK
jgi:ADP-ribosylglycohydrolase